jgi:hypothetical protein
MSAATLRRAAQIVRERGWTQGRYEEEDGRMCVEGAMSLAHGYQAPAGNCDVVADLFALRQVTLENVVDWNDAPERTAEDVIAALEAAADRLDAEARS